MLVVDILHEFELGVWKSLFTQLIRLLYAAGKGSETLVAQLDSRFVVYYSFVVDIPHILSPLDIAKSRHLVLGPFEHFLKTRQK